MVTRRLKKIFKEDGNSFVVACDHGLINGPMKGISNVEDTLKEVVSANIDGVMATYGTVRRFPELFSKTNLVLRLDGTASFLAPSPGIGERFFSIEQALVVGAEAICVTAFPGTKDEEHGWDLLAKTIWEGHKYGIPMMAEIMPGGFSAGSEFRNAGVTKTAARIAAELGADWVKIPFVEGYEEVISTCPVPVVVLGGAGTTPSTTLEMVDKGLKAGCKGATIGRNIWQSTNITLMANVVNDLIHGKITLEIAKEKMNLYERGV